MIFFLIISLVLNVVLIVVVAVFATDANNRDKMDELREARELIPGPPGPEGPQGPEGPSGAMSPLWMQRVIKMYDEFIKNESDKDNDAALGLTSRVTALEERVKRVERKSGMSV